MHLNWITAGDYHLAEDERDVFVVRVLEAESSDSLLVATYAIKKVAWDTWWEEIELELDDSRVPTVASPSAPGPDSPDATPTLAATAVPDSADRWLPTPIVDAPLGRDFPTSIWSGSFMIVWGGVTDDYVSTGGRYSFADSDAGGEGDAIDCAPTPSRSHVILLRRMPEPPRSSTTY